METNLTSPETRLHFLDYWRVVKTRKAIVFVVFLLVLVTTFVFTYVQPKIYMSSVRIKVEQMERPTVITTENTPYTSPYDPFFLQTQYEIIQSQNILYPVVEQLNLQKKWAPSPGTELPLEIAFRRLKGRLSVRRFRDTSLIEISVMDEDRFLAAEIADRVAKVFETQRLEVKRQQTMKGLEKLRDEIKQQQDRVKEAQDKVEKLRKDLNVPIYGTLRLSDVTISQMEQQLTATRIEAVGRRTRLEELKKLNPQQLRNAIVTVVADPHVAKLLQDLTEVDQRLQILKEDYGPDHPTVRSAIAARDKIQEQLNDRIDGVMRGFEVDYKMAQQRVDDLQKQVDDAKTASMVLESDAYRPFRNAQREQELQERLADALKTRLQQISVDLEIPRSPVEVIDQAVPGNAPIKPNFWMNMTVGAFFAVLMGIGLAFFIEFLDTSVKKMEDVERYLGIPVLGVIAQHAGLLSRDEASPSHVEAYRMLRTNIEFATGDGGHKSLAVLSGGAGEGKSFTCANLATVYAQHGMRVLIVDSDLRRPSVHKNFDVKNDVGLADYLAGQQTVDAIIQKSSTPNVSIITSGGGSAKSALPMLTSQRMRELIKEVGIRYDLVLYDTPPVLGVSDAAVVASEVGTAVMVIQHRRFPRAMAQRSRQVIENAGGRLLGVVVNNVNVSQDETYYYYHHHYEDYLRVPARPDQAPLAAKPGGDKLDLPGKY
jgi:capsular exopolysaccharide synthesis family protein